MYPFYDNYHLHVFAFQHQWTFRCFYLSTVCIFSVSIQSKLHCQWWTPLPAIYWQIIQLGMTIIMCSSIVSPVLTLHLPVCYWSKRILTLSDLLSFVSFSLYSHFSHPQLSIIMNSFITLSSMTVAGVSPFLLHSSLFGHLHCNSLCSSLFQMDSPPAPDPELSATPNISGNIHLLVNKRLWNTH